MTVAFKSLPLIVRIATLATFLNCWVLFEELIVDRQGLDRFMPFYRVGAFCVWDAAAIALLLLLWWRLHKG